MNDEKILDGLNAHAPGFIGMLGGRVVALDRAAQSCTFEFDVSHDFCHSVDVIQGGFITAMLDAAMSHAVDERLAARHAWPQLPGDGLPHELKSRVKWFFLVPPMGCGRLR